MAVGANSYGTVARVELLVGDLVASRTFSTTTTPTIAQVEQMIDDTAYEINAALRSNGYTVPVANSSPNVETFGVLRAANSYGAAALVLAMLPSEAWVSNSEADIEITKSRRSFYEKKFNDIIKAINSFKLYATRTGDSMEAYAGSQEDTESGETKLPIFTRSQTDYPGSRTLQES